MKRSVILLLALLTVVGGVAVAIAFTDDFQTNPFNAPARWCNRFHVVNYQNDGTNGYMIAFNGGPAGCSVGLSCTTTSPVPCNTCTNQSQMPSSICSSTDIPNGGGYFLLTTTDYAGENRTAETRFGLAAHMNVSPLTDHISLWPVAGMPQRLLI